MPGSAIQTGKDELLRVYEIQRAIIRRRLKEFSRIPESEYFYELLYCLLTPQSSAVNAGKAIAVLRKMKFDRSEIHPEEYLHGDSYYIRFHRTKARHLLQCKNDFPKIFQQLAGHPSGEELREWLVVNVKGLGWKEASHFLRNIGYRNLAILDRHILRNLHRYGAIPRLPKTLTARNYKQIEQKFRTFSKELGIPLDELDLLFWSMETGMVLK